MQQFVEFEIHTVSLCHDLLPKKGVGTCAVPTCC
jgi:hypothetical protein